MSHRARFSEPGAGTALTVVDAVAVVKIGADDTDGSYELFEILGPAGTGAPMSRHPWAEAYYMLEGDANVTVGAQVHHLVAGASITIPPNAAHAFVITSKHARMLVVSVGAVGGRFFTDMDSNVSLADGPEVFVPKIAEVAARHDVTLLAGAPA